MAVGMTIDSFLALHFRTDTASFQCQKIMAWITQNRVINNMLEVTIFVQA